MHGRKKTISQTQKKTQHAGPCAGDGRGGDVLFLADRTLLYDRIKHLAKSYIKRGWVSVEELEDLNRMHEVYHDSDKLNGNGFLRELMETVNTDLEKRVV